MLVIIAVVAASQPCKPPAALTLCCKSLKSCCAVTQNTFPSWHRLLPAPLTILCGTGHVVYTILPIIYDVAIKNNIRPERPMRRVLLAHKWGLSPARFSVAVVSLVAMLGNVTFEASILSSSTCSASLFRLPCWVSWRSVSSAGSVVRIWIKMKSSRSSFPYLKTITMCMAIPPRC